MAKPKNDETQGAANADDGQQVPPKPTTVPATKGATEATPIIAWPKVDHDMAAAIPGHSIVVVWRYTEQRRTYEWRGVVARRWSDDHQAATIRWEAGLPQFVPEAGGLHRFPDQASREDCEIVRLIFRPPLTPQVTPRKQVNKRGRTEDAEVEVSSDSDAPRRRPGTRTAQEYTRATQPTQENTLTQMIKQAVEEALANKIPKTQKIKHQEVEEEEESESSSEEGDDMVTLTKEELRALITAKKNKLQGAPSRSKTQSVASLLKELDREEEEDEVMDRMGQNRVAVTRGGTLKVPALPARATHWMYPNLWVQKADGTRSGQTESIADSWGVNLNTYLHGLASGHTELSVAGGCIVQATSEAFRAWLSVAIRERTRDGGESSNETMSLGFAIIELVLHQLVLAKNGKEGTIELTSLLQKAHTVGFLDYSKTLSGIKATRQYGRDKEEPKYQRPKQQQKQQRNKGNDQTYSRGGARGNWKKRPR